MKENKTAWMKVPTMDPMMVPTRAELIRRALNSVEMMVELIRRESKSVELMVELIRRESYSVQTMVELI